jgi:hypothetical protein
LFNKKISLVRFAIGLNVATGKIRNENEIAVNKNYFCIKMYFSVQGVPVLTNFSNLTVQ